MLIRILVLATMAGCLAGTVTAQEASQQTAALSSGAVPETTLRSPSVSTDYVIGPQDVLTVDVFGVPDLSGTLQVDNAGFVPVPLIGQVRASGRTTTDLAHAIAAELDKKYVKHPIVTVTVKDPASQKVTVDGEVTLPGVYQITNHTTLTQAVALGHGPTAVADIHHVGIVRNGPNGRTVQVYDLDDIHDGKVADPFLRANDEVVVDSSGSRKFLRDFSSAFSLVWLLRP